MIRFNIFLLKYEKYFLFTINNALCLKKYFQKNPQIKPNLINYMFIIQYVKKKK